MAAMVVRVCFFSSVLAVAVVLATATSHQEGVDFHVVNQAAGHPGWPAFETRYGEEHARQVMSRATTFILQLLGEAYPATTRQHTSVTLHIKAPWVEARPTKTNANNIYMSAQFIKEAADHPVRSTVEKQITVALYREMAHVWQWLPSIERGRVSGVVEGIAHYVVVVAPETATLGFCHDQTKWRPEPRPYNWDNGDCQTMDFFRYCAMFRPSFVGDLNWMMKHNGRYSDVYFQNLLDGKTVDQLWTEYQNYQPRVVDVAAQ